MECNKDEAVRAKIMAEQKLQSKDFKGARVLGLKAQQLYPEIDNILQLLSVCDVHCSAVNQVGNEMDWYGILQVQQTADDISIKKQYRKFALLLHPDKNQFAGAEAAFKLIGEAQRVLLDKEKRASHDMKRRVSYKQAIPHQPASRNAGAVRQSRPHNSFPSNPNSRFKDFNLPNQGQTQQGQAVNGKETFWTLCQHCSSRYQFYRTILSKLISCPGCGRPFVTQELHDSKPVVTEPVILKPEAKKVKPTFDAGFQAGQKAEFSRSQKGLHKVERKEAARSKLQKKIGKRGKKHVVDSSESFESDSSVDSEEVESLGAADFAKSQDFECGGEGLTRRSGRNRQRVSYNENVSDDEQFATPSKKAKGNASPEEKVSASDISESSTEEKANESNVSGSPNEEEDIKKECNMDDRNETAAKSTKESAEAPDGLGSSLEQTPDLTPEPTVYEVPDPEFCDFDQSRDKYCFRAGDLWAVYDNADAMPRYYAKIKKVYAIGFKLQITWLEPDPDDDVGIEWVKSEMQLPFSCGKFKTGGLETTEDQKMFSHMVSGWKSVGRSLFTLYPRVREIWAIFKNWDAKWYLVPDDERKFEYEYVEVLSSYEITVGIRVAPLTKIKGFASLYCRNCVNEIQIQPSEFRRFSHMVPSYRTTGNEKETVPKGYIELDPAATTMTLEEITPPWADKKNGVDVLSSESAGKNAAN